MKEELYKKDGSATGVFYCTDCGTIFVHGNERCYNCHSKICSTCGKLKEEPDKHWIDCKECRAEKEYQKFHDQIKNSEKLDTWDSWVYWEGFGGNNEGYFESIDEMLDWVECENESIREGDTDEELIEIPEYVFCTTKEVHSIDPDWIIDSMLENAHEDFDVRDLNGVDELYDAIEKFNNLNSSFAVSYYPDYTKMLKVK